MTTKQAYKIWCKNIRALLRKHVLGVGCILAAPCIIHSCQRRRIYMTGHMTRAVEGRNYEYIAGCTMSI